MKLRETHCSVSLLTFHFLSACRGLKDPTAPSPCLPEKMKVEFRTISSDTYGYNIIWEPISEFLFEGNTCHEIETLSFEYTSDTKKYKDAANELYFYRFGPFFSALYGLFLNNDLHYCPDLTVRGENQT